MRGTDIARYKSAGRDGVTAIIVNRGRLLVLKRRAIPFTMDPGEWEFVAGSRKRGESHADAAYREVLEETGIPKGRLTLAAKRARVVKTDAKGTFTYSNALYVFCSGSDKVKLNIENSRHRWATYDEIAAHKDYTNVFLNERLILGMIRKVLDAEAAEGKVG